MGQTSSIIFMPNVKYGNIEKTVLIWCYHHQTDEQANRPRYILGSIRLSDSPKK